MFNLGSSFINESNLHNQIYVVLLLFIRIFAAFSGSTLLGKQMLPSIVRASLSLILAGTWSCSAQFNNVHIAEFSSIYVILLSMKEAVYGYLLGVVISTPFLLIDSCGGIIDQQRGEGFAASINPATSGMTSSSGKLLFQTFVVYFVTANGLFMIINIITQSFKIVGLESFVPISPVSDYHIYINFFMDFCRAAVMLAFPVLIVTILIDLVLGLIGSFIPQLNITIFSIPIKSVVVLVILIYIINTIFSNVFTSFIANSKEYLHLIQ